jgi:hypothetical protein
LRKHGDTILLTLAVAYQDLAVSEVDIFDAEVRELNDGEFALVGISEVFEPGDELPPLSDSREMPIRRFSEGAVHVVYDRSYLSSDDRAILDALEALDGVKMEEEGKKASSQLAFFS